MFKVGNSAYLLSEQVSRQHETRNRLEPSTRNSIGMCLYCDTQRIRIYWLQSYWHVGRFSRIRLDYGAQFRYGHAIPGKTTGVQQLKAHKITVAEI